MKQFFTLFKVEAKVALRGLDGVIFGIVMPVAVACLIGFIAKDQLAFEGANYTFIQSAFPSLITVGVCATAFMGIPLTLCDYRDKKILKHYFVTPVSPRMVLVVQVMISFLNALVSSLIVALVMIFGFSYSMDGSILAFIGAYILVVVSMYSLGLLIASVCKSIKIANLVCSFVYFPMLFLSGSTIPFELFPKGLQNVASILPLTQGITLLKGFALDLPVENLLFPIGLMLLYTVVGIILSLKLFRWE